MTKQEKRETTIRNNPKQVRFADLHALLKAADFDDGQPGRGGSHHTYNHPDYPDIVTVPIPHGGNNHVKRPYVLDALKAIDTVRAIAAEREKTRQ
ncbi:MAG: type II toxin-antitoxin system HicA family toxin [Chloroflexota bacterium]|nr:type II toxin-antitoxin system HicA family toxin [Chloroflexota bacterium]